MKEAEKQAETMKSKLSGVGTFLKTSLVAGMAATGAAIVGTVIKNVDSVDDLKKAMNGFQAATHVSAEQVDGFNQALKNIYAGNYGESFDDIADAMAIVTQNSRLLDPTNIEKMTTNALALRDAFGYDIQESMRAVRMLMDQFGISGEEAFNLITYAAQDNLDKNGDLLDSINEYSVHFKQLGIDAEGMFNSLANGTYTGTFSVDKLGDAVKEFGIRVKDQSDSTNAAFMSIGLDANKTAQAFAQGGELAKSAFNDVTQKLLAMQDPLKQNQAGVALFGTMWEDLGKEGIEALTDIEGEYDKNYDALNRIKEIKYDSFGEAMTGIGRQLEVGLLIPLGEKVLPTLNIFASWLNEKLPTSIGKAENVFNSISNFLQPIITTINTMISSFKNLENQSDTSFGKVKETITTILSTIQSIVQGFIDLFNVLWDKWGSDLVSFAQNHFNNIMTVIQNALNLIQGVVSFFTAFLKEDWDSCFSSLLNIASSGWKMLEALHKTSLDLLKGIIQAGVTLIVDVIIGLFGILFTGIKKVWDNIVGWIELKVQNLIAWFENLGSTFYDIGSMMLNNVWSGLQSVWESLSAWVEEKVAWLIEKLAFWRESQDEMSKSSSSIKSSSKDVDGSHKNGLDYVPWDGYTALLHKGERVLTAEENAAYSSNYSNISPISIRMGDITVNGADKSTAEDIGRVVKNQLNDVMNSFSKNFELKAIQAVSSHLMSGARMGY